MLSKRLLWLLLALALSWSLCHNGAIASQEGTPPEAAEPILGRWDVTVKMETQEYPSWFEISKEGSELRGRFVGRRGEVQPIANIRFKDGVLVFTVKYHEWGAYDLEFNGRLTANLLQGTTTWKGETLQWKGVRAPSLERALPRQWGEPLQLFNGTDLSGWKLKIRQLKGDNLTPDLASRGNGWKVVNGVLVNTPPSTDLMTEREFEDFKLHLEFNLSPKPYAGRPSDSGVYLRGRYEIEIAHGFGLKPDSHGIGGIYGFLTPSSNPAKKAGEWQVLEATLVGRRVTVILNNQTIIDNQEIPGITGAAIDSEEGRPGPILLQGGMGEISFRNIVLVPARN